jgi:hypothetical protein
MASFSSAEMMLRWLAESRSATAPSTMGCICVVGVRKGAEVCVCVCVCVKNRAKERVEESEEMVGVGDDYR